MLKVPIRSLLTVLQQMVLQNRQRVSMCVSVPAMEYPLPRSQRLYTELGLKAKSNSLQLLLLLKQGKTAYLKFASVMAVV